MPSTETFSLGVVTRSPIRVVIVVLRTEKPPPLHPTTGPPSEARSNPGKRRVAVTACRIRVCSTVAIAGCPSFPFCTTSPAFAGRQRENTFRGKKRNERSAKKVGRVRNKRVNPARRSSSRRDFARSRIVIVGPYIVTRSTRARATFVRVDRARIFADEKQTAGRERGSRVRTYAYVTFALFVQRSYPAAVDSSCLGPRR